MYKCWYVKKFKTYLFKNYFNENVFLLREFLINKQNLFTTHLHLTNQKMKKFQSQLLQIKAHSRGKEKSTQKQNLVNASKGKKGMKQKALIAFNCGM